jgi:Flp pilus assembly protein TadB
MLTIYKPDWVWRGETWTVTRSRKQPVPTKGVRLPLVFVFWTVIVLAASAMLLFRGVTQKVGSIAMIVTMVLMGITLPLLVLAIRRKQRRG